MQYNITYVTMKTGEKMEINVKQAVVDDYKEIAEICIHDLGYNCSVELVKARLENVDNEREKVFVACVDGKIAGFIHAEKYDALYFEAVVNLLGLAVAQEYRKNGIGRMLLNECESWAKSIGAKYVRANSGSARSDAHIFYRNAGYNNEKMQIRFLKELP